jgi:CspA family cold shock protein
MPSTGTVKWFNNAKGFGFLRTDGEDDDIFVHHTSINADGYRTLKQGETVKFELTRGEKGLKAENVIRVEHMPADQGPQSQPSA